MVLRCMPQGCPAPSAPLVRWEGVSGAVHTACARPGVAGMLLSDIHLALQSKCTWEAPFMLCSAVGAPPMARRLGGGGGAA